MSSNYKVTESEYFSKETEKNKVSPSNSRKRVNLNGLVDRMNIEKKKDQRTSILFSVSAISALIVFGIILTFNSKHSFIGNNII